MLLTSWAKGPPSLVTSRSYRSSCQQHERLGSILSKSHKKDRASCPAPLIAYVAYTFLPSSNFRQPYSGSRGDRPSSAELSRTRGAWFAAGPRRRCVVFGRDSAVGARLAGRRDRRCVVLSAKNVVGARFITHRRTFWEEKARTDGRGRPSITRRRPLRQGKARTDARTRGGITRRRPDTRLSFPAYLWPGSMPPSPG